MWKHLLLLGVCCFAPQVQGAAQVLQKVYISGLSWSPQTRNNCGPQALSSILQYWGYTVDQATIAERLKACPTCYMRSDVIDPFVQVYGLRAQRFKNGSLLHIKQLVANGVPVLVLQYLNTPGKIPHFRIVTGFDDRKGVFYINDPYYAPTATLSYRDFDRLWDSLYGREFISIHPASWQTFIERVLHIKPAQTGG